MTPAFQSYQREFFLALRASLQQYNLWMREEYSLGSYYADVYVHPSWVFEIDGPEHSVEPKKSRDLERTAYLQSLGKIVTRFTNLEVERDLARIIAQSVAMVVPEFKSVDPPVIRAHNVKTSNGRFAAR